MTHWETIHDPYSQVKRVRLVPPRNFSTERGNIIFDGKAEQNKKAPAVAMGT